jgi:uroporphyrinogen decarboxylase
MPVMTHRDRVLAALAHIEPDRVPMDFGSTRTTGATIPAYRRLRSYLGLPESAERPVECIDLMQQLALVEEDVLRALDVDARGVFLGAPDGFQVHIEQQEETEEYVDEWGVRRRRVGGSFYFDLVHSPLAGEPDLRRIERYPWPDPHDPGRYRRLKEQVQQLTATGEFAVVVSPASGPLHITQYLRGFEDWFTDLLAAPAFAEALFERVFGIACEMASQALDLVGRDADVVFLGDDLGTQLGPQVSPAVYRRLIKPYQRRLFDVYHAKSPGKVLYHTCGSVVALIPDLIEIGVDVLNPVQVRATGMDPVRLKREYGRDLSFWGGIDTQEVLPRGAAEDVRQEVARRIGELGPSGGYVLNSVHNVQPDVPPENIVAMFGAGREYGRYPTGTR